MKASKDNIRALIGTILFHGVILLILCLVFLKAEMPKEEGGVLVNFGNVDIAAGTFEPKYSGQTAALTPPPPELPKPTPIETPEEVETQDIEESVTINEADKKKEEEKRKKEAAEAKKQKAEAEKQEKLRREEAERKRLAEERRKKEEAINKRVFGAFGAGQTASSNQGSASNKQGNQGSLKGNSDKGQNVGEGGYGSFNLNGRSIGSGGLPKPVYTVQEEGRIVINITVNPQGKVIFAEIGRGTNIDNVSMRQSALVAAKKAIFNSIKGTNNQTGTITYRYNLL